MSRRRDAIPRLATGASRVRTRYAPRMIEYGVWVVAGKADWEAAHHAVDAIDAAWVDEDERRAEEAGLYEAIDDPSALDRQLARMHRSVDRLASLLSGERTDEHVAVHDLDGVRMWTVLRERDSDEPASTLEHLHAAGVLRAAGLHASEAGGSR